jgi:hypothetical protein
MEGALNNSFPNVVEANEAKAVKTFWTFRREPTPSGEAFLLEKFSNDTATTVLSDWGFLFEEIRRVVVSARSQNLSLKAVREMVPNLAHWTSDGDLQELLAMCSDSGEDDETDTANRDTLGRRKRIPIKHFVDNLMGHRLGEALETIRSYRQRGARIARQKMG